MSFSHPAPTAARALAALLVASLGACTGASPGQDNAEAGGFRAPEVLLFSANVDQLIGPESITFAAIVTDPDGIEDVIGGVLLDPDTENTYGAFATSASEGAYALTLSWAQISQVSSIDFDDGDDRVFVARFFDQSGAYAEAEMEVELACENGASACDGQCGQAFCDGQCKNPFNCSDFTCPADAFENGICDCGCGQIDPECPSPLLGPGSCFVDHCDPSGQYADPDNSGNCVDTECNANVPDGFCLCACFSGEIDADCSGDNFEECDGIED